MNLHHDFPTEFVIFAIFFVFITTSCSTKTITIFSNPCSYLRVDRCRAIDFIKSASIFHMQHQPISVAVEIKQNNISYRILTNCFNFSGGLMRSRFYGLWKYFSNIFIFVSISRKRMGPHMMTFTASVEAGAGSTAEIDRYKRKGIKKGRNKEKQRRNFCEDPSRVVNKYIFL